MNGLKYLCIITSREYARQYTEFFSELGMQGVLGSFATGTASTATLDYFGLEKTEKVMFHLLVRNENIPMIKRGLLQKMNIGGIGNGIAVFVPMDGIGGEAARRYLVGDKPIEKGDNTQMQEVSKFVLMITIADKGHTETVMNAARSAGATGGTSVRAKGTGASIAKFFGVAISEEKEMIYIVSKRENRDGIMHAIMEKAGKDTPAHGIVFSLPVDSVCGINSFSEDEE